MKKEKFTPHSAFDCRREKRKFSMISVYDYPTAKFAEEAGINSLLVGDSLAMTVLGHQDTISITMEEMLHHVKAVSRASQYSMVVADMPFMSYQISSQQAVENAGRFLKEGRADAVKVEGGNQMAETVNSIFSAGISVIGHIGLTPQSSGQLGGLKVQGKTVDSAKKLLNDAISLQEAGAFSILMECVPAKIASVINEKLDVPTISYGSGPSLDAQGLVGADILGLFDLFQPKFSKRYSEIGLEIKKAFRRYHDEVISQKFPYTDNQYNVPEIVLQNFLSWIKNN